MTDCVICAETVNINTGHICRTCGNRWCTSCQNGMDGSGGEYRCPMCRSDVRPIKIGVVAPVRICNKPLCDEHAIPNEPYCRVHEEEYKLLIAELRRRCPVRGCNEVGVVLHSGRRYCCACFETIQLERKRRLLANRRRRAQQQATVRPAPVPEPQPEYKVGDVVGYERFGSTYAVRIIRETPKMLMCEFLGSNYVNGKWEVADRVSHTKNIRKTSFPRLGHSMRAIQIGYQYTIRDNTCGD